MNNDVGTAHTKTGRKTADLHLYLTYTLNYTYTLRKLFQLVSIIVAVAMATTIAIRF